MLDGISILLVEDEPALLQLFSQVLEAEGAVVTPVSTVRDAIAAALARPAQVIVTDVQLPDGTAVSLLEALACAAASPHRPFRIIAMSGWPGQDSRLACDYDEYLEKPFAPADLVAAIARVLSSVRAR